MSLEQQAHNVFAHYVMGNIKDLRISLTDFAKTPEHLNFCIDAVDLAYPSHLFSPSEIYLSLEHDEESSSAT